MVTSASMGFASHDDDDASDDDDDVEDEVDEAPTPLATMIPAKLAATRERKFIAADFENMI